MGQIYQNGYLEIHYHSPEFKSSDIIIKADASIPFDSAALSYFNIKPVKPDEFIAGKLWRWKNLDGFKTISFYSPVYQNDSLKSFTAFFKY